MANRMTGAARRLSRSMSAEARTLELRSVTRFREGWTAKVTRQFGGTARSDRAIGELFWDGHKERNFNVAVDELNCFVVGVGTSGAKVKFCFAQ